MKSMVVVNLHEIDFIEEVLKSLAECSVKDCIVYNVDCVASHHGSNTDLAPTVLGSISKLFSQERNLNRLIIAVTDDDRIEDITESLKALYKDDRWVSSFWFIPIRGYFYHKHNE